jgi:acyl-lipid omega-6 desaturase (Delta-12 desaturase)
MHVANAKQLRAALEPYAQPAAARAWFIFFVTLAAYVATVAGALLLVPLAARLVCAVLASVAISSLFVIGHDAAHGAYTGSRRLNALIGRLAFLPALHNYSLWQVQHNRLHHRLTNLKGFNSWWPLTKAEYDALPAWRRARERLYRGPLGFAPYYLVERWWKDKFFPRRGRERRRVVFWLDFALLAAYLAVFLAGLGLIGSRLPQTGALAAIFWGFVVPFAAWNFLIGATIYMQHTHLRVPWFEALSQWREIDGQHEVTVHVQLPRWYNLVSHNIMEHPAHHAHPKVPLYRLAAAQRRLNELLGEHAVIQRFTPAYLLRTLACCKLYDYRRHCWLDFAGRPTSECTLPPSLRQPIDAAAAPTAAVA